MIHPFGTRTLLDAGTGSRLLAQGVDPTGAALDAPERLRALHAADVEAGAEWVTAATFSATEADAIREALAIALSLGRPVLASLGPLGTPSELRRRAELCLKEGAAFIALETFVDDEFLVDVVTALRGLPVLASFCPLSGHVHAPQRIVEAGASAIGVNCGDGAEALIDAGLALVGLGLPVVVRPSAGLPNADGDYPLAATEFGAALDRAWAAGVQAAGGCCGVTPTHLRHAKERKTTA